MTVLIAGKLPPPYMGPAVATQIILGSALRERFRLVHLDTKANDSLLTLGRWSVRKVFRNLAIYCNLVAKCVRYRPRIVLIPISQSTTGFVKDSALILLAWLCRRRVLVQLRGSNFRNWLGRVSAPVRGYVRFVLNRTRGVIVLGDCLRYLFENHFPPDRIYVAPNGADYTFPPSPPPDGTFRILYLGNFQAAKGLADLLQALVLLKQRIPEGWQADIVGQWRDDATRLRSMRLIEEHLLPVTVHPPLAGTAKLERLAHADALVFVPREPEGHPWVIVEALAAGLPVISTDQGAITESVIDGVNGFIVGASRPDQVADRIAELLQDGELRRRMGESSRQHYTAHFTEARMVDHLTDAFRRAAG